MTQVFHIAPSTGRGGGLIAIAVLLIVVLGVAFGLVFASMRGSRTSTFELSNEGLRLRGDIYGRMIPARDIVGRGVQRVDISHGPYHPTVRTSGTAVPGYRSGWFRLTNGHKALLYVTDPDQVVLVPTTAGYDVLLSVAEADDFVARMHAAGTFAAQ